MTAWRLARPEALALLAVAAAIAIAGVASLLRDRRLLRAAYGPQARRVAPRAGGPAAASPLAIACAGLALLAVAIAGPERIAEAPARPLRGIDLAIALDASRSMRAADLLPDRLSRAKLELSALLERRPGDEVALVAFAGSAAIRSPLGADHGALRLLLETVDPAAMPSPGTALGPALDAAARALGPARPGRGRAVLLLTDGEDHQGGAAAAAARLASEGILLVVVGIGSEAGAAVPPVPGRPGGAPVVSRLAAGALRELAAAGGGTYLQAAAVPSGLVEVDAALARISHGELARRAGARWVDEGWWLAAAAFLLLVAAAALPLVAGRARPPVAAAALLVLGVGAAPFRAEHRGVGEANRLVAHDPAGALERYDAAERELGPAPELDLGRGGALAALGRAEEAARAFGLAARAPGALGSRGAQNLAHARLALGDEEGALAALREALAKDASNQAARHDLEVLLRRRIEERRPPREGETSTSTATATATPTPTPTATATPTATPTATSTATSTSTSTATATSMSRAEAERLLDAVAAAERPLPATPAPRSPRGTKDW